ncbi:MAG: hypothetical protein ABSH20_07960 [Tepidisphaeraceae bacterium]
MSRSRMLWTLAALNAVLVVALCWKLGGENTAYAQRAGRGDYIMLPGRIPTAQNGVIYMVDTRNGLLTSFMYDSNRSDFVPMEPINLTRIFDAGPSINPTRNPPRKP